MSFHGTRMNSPVPRARFGRLGRGGAVASVALAVLGAVIQGCAPGQGSDVGATRSLAYNASATTRSELGVASWKIEADAESARVVGLDNAGSPQVEVVVRQAPPPAIEGVSINVVRPAAGEFVLSPNGQIDRAVTGDHQRLAAALHRDLGQAEQPDVPASLSAASSGSLSFIGPNSIEWWDSLPVYGNLFGVRENFILQRLCRAGHVRDHYVAYSNNGCSCWVNHWATELDGDCAVFMHTGAAPFWIDTCNVFVYGHTP